MSLMSVREKLNNAALEDGASKEDLLRAALAASNDRYEKAVREQNARLDRLEAAVRASNEQRAIDVQGALKNAAEAILGDVRTESAAYIKAMDEAAARLNAALVDVPLNLVTFPQNSDDFTLFWQGYYLLFWRPQQIFS